MVETRFAAARFRTGRGVDDPKWADELDLGQLYGGLKPICLSSLTTQQGVTVSDDQNHLNPDLR